MADNEGFMNLLHSTHSQNKEGNDPPLDIKYYEMTGKTIKSYYEKLAEYWLSGVGMKHQKNIINGELKDVKEYKHTSDILYISGKPKWKWFRPPMFLKIWKWKISFLWAYDIDKKYILTDAYPTSISAYESSTDKSSEIHFKASTLDNIDDKISDEIKKRGEINTNAGENVTNGSKE